MCVKAASFYITFVAVGRNDNFGGDFLGRMTAFARNVLMLAEEYELSAELIVVEWNPPDDRARLRDSISWPRTARRFCQARIIEVPAALHRKMPNSERMPMFEYIGKNVGVRRARAEYVLVTNPDILFSRGLMRTLKEVQLRRDCYYRAARYDVKSPVPEGASIDEELQYCSANILQKHGYVYSPRWVRSRRFNPYRWIRAAAGYCRWAVWNRTFINPYVNAAGDFFLMHKTQWEALRGFPELKSHSYIDSYMTYMAHTKGYKLRILWGDDVYLYHQDHSRTEHATRPLSDVEEYHRNCKTMVRQKRPIVFNDEDWGLDAESLPECSIYTENPK